MSAHADTPEFRNGSQLSALFDSLDEGVIVWDSRRTIVYANPTARRITRLPLIIGTPLLEATERMSARVMAGDNLAKPAGELPVYRAFRGENVPREEMRYIDPDGNHRWLAVSAKRILDEAGQLTYVLSSMRDISLRKSRENKLDFMVESAKILSLNLDFKNRLVEKAKLTVPNLADWCIVDVLNEDGTLERVALINEHPAQTDRLIAFERDFPRDEERPSSVRSVISRQEPLLIKNVSDDDMRTIARSPEHLRRMLELNVRSLMVIPIISRGIGVGAMTLAYGQSGRTYDEVDLEFFQEFCYHLSVVFDNARLFEEIEMRDKSKDIFLAALSHELRNPLAPIKSSLELLKLRDAPYEIRDELEIIEHQFDHMARLLNDLLDVTRFTQDRIALSSRPIELRRLIERSQKATDSLVRHSDITLHFAYPSLPIHINADETRLEQAVSNLLSNAVKFTPAGGSIWLDLEREGNDAIIRVRDNGAGITPEDLPNIFDMYYQGVNQGPVNSGLGIGLLLVQRIVNMHGGSVEAKSQGVGTGSEFIIRLPLAETSIPDSLAVDRRSLARGLRILVVDDNAPAADSLVKLLNKLGARAQAVYSAHEALGCERLGEVDLFLLDVGMPHMDGYELVAALKQRGISAPIVALTGYGLSEDKKRSFEAGFASHLTKPVGLSDLNGLFENVLSINV